MLTVTLIVVLVALIGIGAMALTRRNRPKDLERDGPVHELRPDAHSPIGEAERDVMQHRQGP